MSRTKEELQADIFKSDRAEALLNDPLVKSALSNIKETCFKNFTTTHWKNAEEREELYKMMKAIEAFENEFKKQIQGGIKARSLLDKLLLRSD